jgi:hypothetical protein
MVRAAEAGRSRRARRATLGNKRRALALDASDAGRALKSDLRAVVDEGLLRGASASRIRRITLRFEHREARLFGRTKTEDLFLAAAVRGV